MKTRDLLAHWTLAGTAVIAADWCLAGAAPPIRMVGIVTSLFLAMKNFVYRCWRVDHPVELPALAVAAFAFPWPGMRPNAFVTRFAHLDARTFEPMVPFVAGIACIAAARTSPVLEVSILRTVLILAGLSLIVHYGILGWLTAGYRTLGWNVKAPFLNPLKARSLSEFWSCRWNRPFTEMLVPTLYRPVAKCCGSTAAVLAGFMVSGLLHEMAISLPVRSGYGLPTLYFLIQGIGVVFERIRYRTGEPPRIFVWCVLLLPLPLVFHEQFVVEVLFPIVGLQETHFMTL